MKVYTALLVFLYVVGAASTYEFQLRSHLLKKCLSIDKNDLEFKQCDGKKDRRAKAMVDDDDVVTGKVQFRSKCLSNKGDLTKCSKAPVIVRIGKEDKMLLTIGAQCLTAGAKLTFSRCVQNDVSQHWEVIRRPMTRSHVFARNKLISYNLELTASDVQRLVADPSAEVYVPCSFVTDYGTNMERKWGNAGCRYKGAVGSLRMCVDPKTRRENNDCRKLSLKVNAGKFGNSTLINNLDKWVFNGMPVDYSLMSERLVYQLYKDAKITSPRAVHAKIYVNGRFNGVYTLVESIDKEFTKHRFKKDLNDGKGALYKDTWFNDLSDARYFAKYRESKKNEDAFMLHVAKEIQTAPLTRVSALRILRKYFDVQSLIDVIAMNMVLGATDDWRIRHNFFVYVKETEIKKTNSTSKKIVMLPWDFDRINDEKAEQRGSKDPWYKIPSRYSTEGRTCSAPLIDTRQMAMEMSRGDQQIYEHFKIIWDMLPLDMNRVIQCDQLTKLMSLALTKAVLARTVQLTQTKTSPFNIKRHMAHFGAQIAEAQLNSGDRPYTISEWNNEIQKLYDYILKVGSRTKSQAAAEGVRSDNYEEFLWENSNTITTLKIQYTKTKPPKSPGNVFTFPPTPPPTAIPAPRITTSHVPVKYNQNFGSQQFGSSFGSSQFVAPPQVVAPPQFESPQQFGSFAQPQQFGSFAQPQQFGSSFGGSPFAGNLPGSFMGAGGFASYRG
eukprot:CAMPEP_0175138122 /NCGR_PEP_ID=MMETSP0087-20121206/10175_1 /TAXON_ID=136419 /ORGANISM="Unknown Unknown, Strain D1" /LENGTH=721 /DNA_ID=CAMNT_0016420993 /DNA_START=46 /DNA_END=2211 /DNA_ORIENTATION=+